jgi:hypothetical protein
MFPTFILSVSTDVYTAFSSNGQGRKANGIYRHVLFYTRVTFLKNDAQIEHIIPIPNSVFPGSCGNDLILYSI